MSQTNTGFLTSIKNIGKQLKGYQKDAFVEEKVVDENEVTIDTVRTDWQMKSMNSVEAWIGNEKHAVEAEVILNLDIKEVLSQKDRNEGLNLGAIDEAMDAIDPGKEGEELEELVTMALVPRSFAQVHSIVIHKLEPKINVGGVVVNEKQLVATYLIDDMLHLDYGSLLIPAAQRESIVLDPALFAHKLAIDIHQFEKRDKFERFFEFEDSFGNHTAEVKVAARFEPR